MSHDRAESAWRLGCGGVFGVALGASYSFGSLDGWVAKLLASLILGAVCAWAALRYGDQFWQRLRPYLWWW